MVEMLKQIAADPDKLKRVLVTLLAAVTPVVNKKFGLGLDHVEIATIVAALIGYVAQSGHHSAMVNAAAAGTEAEKKVVTAEDADKVIGGVK